MTIHFKGWDNVDGSRISAKQTEKAFGKVMNRAALMEESGKKRHSILFKMVVCSSAAAAILILGIFLGKGTGIYTHNLGQCEIISANGQKSDVILPDGSRIKLNSATRIAYSKGFGISDRNIELVGEAFFEVAKNEKLPFIVKTSGMSVEALGTKFNVRSYDNEDQAVTLIEGKVLAKSGNTGAILHPNQSITCECGTGRLGKPQPTDPNLGIPWINGCIEFKGDNLSSVATTIERMYDMHVVFEDESIRDFRYTGVVSNASLNTLLDIISETSPIAYNLTGSTISFYRK
ncbi:MAG: FecR family protein [Candidatus Cryptobacteroides sp.]